MKKLFYVTLGVSIITNVLFLGLFLHFNHEKIIAIRRMIISKLRHNQNSEISGKWKKIRLNTNQLSSSQIDQIKKLESLVYLSGYEPAPKTKNITIYNKDLAYYGFNLYCSGHKPEAILMDMEGNELYNWTYSSRKSMQKRKRTKGEYFRRIHLFKNGDLLAIYPAIGLIKLDKDSNLICSYSCKAHHDMFVTKSGKIYLLTNQAKINSKYNKNKPILEDFILVLDPDFQKIKQVSVLKCLENSDYAPILKKIKKSGDVFHTNTIEVLDNKLANRSPAFNERNVLISIRELSFMCVVDLCTERVVWGLADLWERQHQPTVLENGNMLIFDNNGDSGRSRILEFDPITQQIFWSYTNSSDGKFFSDTCGSCARLTNENTLISESDSGRAFEVTPGKKIAWEFISPYRAGKKTN